jgi:Cleavage and polyadenylation factor 2 C-terminal
MSAFLSSSSFVVKVHNYSAHCRAFVLILLVCVLIVKPLLPCLLLLWLLVFVVVWFLVTFEVREEPAGIGQPESVPKFGIGESYGRPGEILEDDYGISVQPERFIDIVSGVDPSKFAPGTGRIGEEMKRGFGYGVTDPARTSSSNSNSGFGKNHKLVTMNKSKKNIHNNRGMKSNTSRVVSEDEEHDEIDQEYNEEELEALDLSEGTGIIRGRNGRPPMKVYSVYRQVECLAEISYSPGLEGRVDARAARQSVRALQPREVIVLGGARQQPHHHDYDTKDSTTAATGGKNNNREEEIPFLIDEVNLLAEAAKTFATGSKTIFAPSDNEVAELEIGHAAYNVRLIDTPYVSSTEKEMEGYEPPDPIEIHETKVGTCSVSLLDCIANGQKVALDGSIVLAPRKHVMPEHWISSDIDHIHPPVYVSDGDVLLTDLRSELIAQGMKSEYTAHSGYSQLLINGKIIVRKDAQPDNTATSSSSNEYMNTGNNDIGNISIEGPLCEDFYLVRSIINAQFVVLS